MSERVPYVVLWTCFLAVMTAWSGQKLSGSDFAPYVIGYLLGEGIGYLASTFWRRRRAHD